MIQAASPGFASRFDSLGLWFASVTLGIVLVLGISSTLALIGSATWVDHTHRVIEALDDMGRALSEATNSRRGFSLTGDGSQLVDYGRALRNLTEAERRTRVLTLDNPGQQQRLDGLEPLIASRLRRQSAALEYRRTGPFDPAREANEARAGSLELQELNGRLSVLIAEEQRLLGERQQRTTNSVAITKSLEVAGAATSVCLIAAVIIRLRREILRRERSEQTLRINERAIKSMNDDLERRVDERTAQLGLANRELESFSYSVVHDLRAPLRGMGGFAEILLAEHGSGLNADAQDCLHEIQENARKMATLIDALLSMSRITRAELRPTRVDLSVLALAVVRELAAVDARPLVELVIESQLDVEIDPNLARTLVEVLLHNSWKFTSKTPLARIEIGTVTVDGEQAWFVRDNGAGFDMAHADKLFAPFGRLHTDQEFPGAGVGLATAARIVQRHGGRIWANACLGAGATVYFTVGPKREEKGMT